MRTTIRILILTGLVAAHHGIAAQTPKGAKQSGPSAPAAAAAQCPGGGPGAARRENRAFTPGEVVFQLSGFANVLPPTLDRQAVGYLPVIAGFPQPIFSGTPKSVKTAHFTFVTSTIHLTEVFDDWCDPAHVNLVGDFELRIYYTESPNQELVLCGDGFFQNPPELFSSGTLVAVYRLESMFARGLASGNPTLIEGNARLLSAPEFQFQGKTLSFKDLAPYGLAVRLETESDVAYRLFGSARALGAPEKVPKTIPQSD